MIVKAETGARPPSDDMAGRIAEMSVLASADFRVLVDESVLHRRIGAPEVMAMQLEHLLTMGRVRTSRSR